MVVEQIAALPAPGLDALRPHAVVRQQAALVAPHAQVVDEQRARRRRVLPRVERVLRQCLAILVGRAAVVAR